MSAIKIVSSFFTRIHKNYDVKKKFRSGLTPGQRIVPTRTTRNDASYQLRIDAGETTNNILRIVLQVNRQARSQVLKNWLAKNSSHAKLATADINLNDITGDEIMAALERLEAQAKENLSKE